MRPTRAGPVKPREETLRHALPRRQVGPTPCAAFQPGPGGRSGLLLVCGRRAPKGPRSAGSSPMLGSAPRPSRGRTSGPFANCGSPWYTLPLPVRQQGEPMRKTRAVTWVVYKTAGQQGEVRAVCEQGEWDEMEKGRPGQHTLIKKG